MKNWFKILSAVCALNMLLVACGGTQVGPVATVQKYLQARVVGDVEQMSGLACSAWEAQAGIEASTFQALQAQLQDVNCAETSNDGSNAVVACTGKIVTTYNGENKEWNLADRQFKVVLDGGEWRMCGYE